MNIFYLDKNPKLCAQYHVDRHVVKMILETAQLLSTAHWLTGGEGPYRATHKNHPSAIWARSNKSNYNWLCKLGLELCEEYTYRYGKIHKTQQHLEWLSKNITAEVITTLINRTFDLATTLVVLYVVLLFAEYFLETNLI